MKETQKRWLWFMAGFVILIAPIYLAVLFWQHQDREFSERLKKMEVTPLDRLESVAGTGKVIHIEAITLGNPSLQSSNGSQIAFQKLTATTLRYTGRLRTHSRYCPQYFLVGDGKGLLWICSADFANGMIDTNKNSQRDVIAKDLLFDYDEYINKMFGVIISTIPRGVHVSAIGKVVKEASKSDKLTHYVLHAPTHADSGERLLIAQ